MREKYIAFAVDFSGFCKAPEGLGGFQGVPP